MYVNKFIKKSETKIPNDILPHIYVPYPLKVLQGVRGIINNRIIIVTGDHYSRFSIFGCKYRFKPDHPVERKVIRGAIFGKFVTMKCLAIATATDLLKNALTFRSVKLHERICYNGVIGIFL